MTTSGRMAKALATVATQRYRNSQAKTYQAKRETHAAARLSGSLLSVNGSLHTGAIEGQTALVENVGRPASAAYAAAQGAGAVIINRGGSGVGTGTGELVPHDLDSPLHLGLLSWGRVNKAGASLADLPTRKVGSLQELNTDFATQYVHINSPRTIAALHTFQRTGPPFAVAGAAINQKVVGLNADSLDGWDEDVFTRKNADATQQMNGFPITSDNDDIQYTLGRSAIGYVGHDNFAGFAARGYANATGYALVQAINTIGAGAGDTHINRPNGSNMYFKKHNLTQMRLEGDEFVFSSPLDLRSHHYASQTTGWRVTYAGAADFRYLYADEMHVKAFIADLEMALAGGQIICKSVVTLAEDFTVPNYSAATALVADSFPGFPNAYVFQNGDTIGIKIVARTTGTSTSPGSLTVAWVFGTVVFSSNDTSAKKQTWTFTRLSSTVINGVGAAGGTATAGTVIETGAIALDFGVSGNGYYEVNAIDGQMGANSPYAQFVTWDTHPMYDRAVMSRMGNLTGLSFTGEFGLYARGASADEYIKATGTGITTRNLSYNAYNGSTKTLDIQPDGDFFIGSNIGAVATTAVAIFGANRTYNGEAVTAGDVLMGNHGGANMLWDISAGQLKFRGGTSTQAYISSAGAFVAGNDNVILDSGGLDLESDVLASPVQQRRIDWWPDLSDRTDAPVASVYGQYSSANGTRYLILKAKGRSASGAAAAAMLQAENEAGSTNSFFQIADSGEIQTDGFFHLNEVAFTPGSGWIEYGTPYGPPTAQRFGSLVKLSGLILSNSATPASTIDTLNANYRPAYKRVFHVWTSQGIKRLDIDDDGNITTPGWSPGNTDWISLDGVPPYFSSF